MSKLADLLNPVTTSTPPTPVPVASLPDADPPSSRAYLRDSTASIGPTTSSVNTEHTHSAPTHDRPTQVPNDEPAPSADAQPPDGLHVKAPSRFQEIPDQSATHTCHEPELDRAPGSPLQAPVEPTQHDTTATKELVLNEAAEPNHQDVDRASPEHASTLTPTPLDTRSEVPASSPKPDAPVKNEPSPIPVDDTPATSRPTPVIELSGTEQSPPPQAEGSDVEGTGTAAKPDMVAPKAESTPITKTERKRPPKNVTAKKGTAAGHKKTQAKKRKLDIDEYDDTPSSKRSATPASSRASKTPATAARRNSSTPAAHSSSPAAEGGDIFCICRRPDDHTWMIGCDGGCEDWFHGKCVSIKEEDGDLIDKYICPNCASEGKGHTTWKPMCRLDGCRQPARLSKDRASKYCCDEHGREFWRQHTPSEKKRKRLEHEEEDGSTTLGGPLSKAELATIVRSVKNVGEFRSMGDGVLSPPPTAHSNHGDVHMTDNGDDPDANEAERWFNDEERARVQRIRDSKEGVVRRLGGLKSREQFVQLVRDRAKKVLGELTGTKDICGFDARLAWTEEEFLAWKDSDDGRQAFATGVLMPPTDVTDESIEGDESAIGAGVCQKKRCERHKLWRNLQVQEIRFDEAHLTDELHKLQREESEVRERAKLRRIKESEGDREGRIEVVEQATT
ncbi:MAG: hypothetical protein M1838_000893 [Thelocarpon superellum]|nr:MAG: hypothetical protein M1838_000893 [Thelocarpon superellum]